MSGRLLSASTLALTLAVLASRPGIAAAQTPVPDAPTDGETPAPPPEPPPEATPPPDTTAPGDFEPPPSPPDPPPAPPAEVVEPPPADVAQPDEFPPEPAPSTQPTAPPPTKSPPPPSPTKSPPPSPPPPTQTPTRAPPPPSAAAPASTDADTAAPPPASPAPAAEPAHRENVREATKRRTDADKRQRWRHGGFILDARIGATGCTRAVCQGSGGHKAAPGLNLGGFVGFNLFGLIELGLEGGWNTLKPRDVAGRNAMALYGLDPAQLQQAIAADQTLPIPMIDFSSLDVTSATSRAFDVGPSLRIHLLRKGRGLLFVGAGVHYQLYRNRYATPAGDFRLDTHGASLPLRVGAGVFVHRNLALMAEVAYAPAIFGGMSFRLGDTRGIAPFKIIEDVTGIKLGRGLPHFWTVSLTLRFRL